MAAMMSRDPFDPTEALTEVKTRKEKDERYIRRVKKALAYVMDTPKGREAMEIILDATGMYRPSFNTNALTMAFNEGRRSVGLALLNLIDPTSYETMLRESHERRSNERS